MSQIVSALEPVLAAVERRIPPQSFDAWFRPVRVRVEETQVVLRVPNVTFRDWISANYGDVLRESLGEVDLDGRAVTFVIDEAPGEPGGFLLSGIDADARRPAVATQRVPGPAAPDLPLNPKYTFESFVVGSSNQFAHAAALAVVDAPGKTYNPLYIYGGVGLGKTHLMHAIGQEIKLRNGSLRICYISSECFMNELIQAIRFDGMPQFREKYRTVDVLLIDDIQFLARKERTQEEFFHTFNALYDQQKQIVISSDCAPRDIPTLEERLHSRFEWGLIADIQAPDLETKVAILERKAEAEGVDLPDDVALYIAQNICSNVRELEGSFVRLAAYASLGERPIDVDLAERVLKNVLGSGLAPEDSRVTINTIKRTVAAEFGLSVADLTSKTNARAVSYPRQIAMYLAKMLTRASLPEIGRELGGKHHTTVLHSVAKIADLHESDQELRTRLDRLVAALRAD